MKIAVLGCGPAGMMAAWAAHTKGHDVKIFAPGERSKISGAQYLHDEIPGIDIIPMHIEFKKFGSAEGYARKLYGDPMAPCSWRNYSKGKHVAYPLGVAYDAAWAALQYALVPCTVNARQLAGLRHRFDLVISTIPKPSLCLKNGIHKFDFKPVFIKLKEPPEIEGRVANNTIIYNGFETDDWYRCSNIQGVLSTEYVNSKLGGIRVTKPLENDCDCHNGVMFVGRYGKWQKGALVHNAYYEVEYALQSMH